MKTLLLNLEGLTGSFIGAYLVANGFYPKDWPYGKLAVCGFVAWCIVYWFEGSWHKRAEN